MRPLFSTRIFPEARPTMLALLPCAATAYSPQARAVRAPHGQHAHQRARAVTLSEDVATTPATAFAAKKAALIAGLKRE